MKAWTIIFGIIFLVLFMTLAFYKYKLEKEIIDTSAVQINHEVESLLALTSKQITQTVYDYTYWDDFVKALHKNDTSWYLKNITFSTFHFHYVLYNTRFEKVHSGSHNEFALEVMIPQIAVVRLKQTRFSHFFLATASGLLEVSAASVHPSNDPEHNKTEPSGYIFVMRKWDKEFLNNLATISGSTVDLIAPSDSAINLADNILLTGVNLKGDDGNIVSRIEFTRILSLNFKVMQNIMIVLLVFVFAALLASNYIARRVINNPLNLVTQILKNPGIRSIDLLKKSPAEFGRIGLLFEEFFLQKAEKERNAIALLAERKIKEATQKRQIELEIKNKELEQFAYIASHDLQEPLRTVSNYMQVFEEDYLPLLDDRAIKYLHSVNAATQRMSILIKSILAFSRLGKNARLSLVDCNVLINKVISNLDTLITTSNTFIEIAGMPILNVYEDELQELFSHLIMNAIKFQPKGKQPRIYIHSKFTDNKWEFSVSDNGIGIAPAYLDQVFNIFKRLNANEEKYEGMGIGLANCKKIVQLHQGRIWCESLSGQGSTFYFTIPNLTI